MNERGPVVYVVDDDDLSRNFFVAVLARAGFVTETVDCAESFLQTYDPEQPGCLLLDVHMPRMNGLELQRHLNRTGSVIPVIFVTAHADVPIAVQAMAEGAFDFLQHPVPPNKLCERVGDAVRFDAENRSRIRQRDQVAQRFKTLSEREREVLPLVLAGHASKVIAGELGLSHRTVELCRARIMEKTGSRSLAQLVRMALDTEYLPVDSRSLEPRQSAAE